MIVLGYQNMSTVETMLSKWYQKTKLLMSTSDKIVRRDCKKTRIQKNGQCYISSPNWKNDKRRKDIFNTVPPILINAYPAWIGTVTVFSSFPISNSRINQFLGNKNMLLWHNVATCLHLINLTTQNKFTPGDTVELPVWLSIRLVLLPNQTNGSIVRLQLPVESCDTFHWN